MSIATTAHPTKLYQALLLALRDMGPIRKTATNPGFRSKYADLPSILDTIDEPLHAHGLLVVQRLDALHGEHQPPYLLTELIHAESGETLTSAVAVVSKDPTDPQKFGSALTYYRRYALLALLGLAPEDDDGNAASQPARTPAPSQTRSAPRRDTEAPLQVQSPSPPALKAARETLPVPVPCPECPHKSVCRSEGYCSREVAAVNNANRPPQVQSPQPAPPDAAQTALPAPPPLTDAGYKKLFEDAWTLVEDGSTYLDIVAFVKGSRDRMTDAQFNNSRDEVKLIRRAIEERDKALQPASYAG